MSFLGIFYGLDRNPKLLLSGYVRLAMGLGLIVIFLDYLTTTSSPPAPLMWLSRFRRILWLVALIFCIVIALIIFGR